MSRRRCRQEGAAPPPSLRRLRSTPPASLRSVRRVPACRAVRSVPRYPGPRAPPDRCPCRRPAPAIGIHRRRSGSRPRPARPARAGRHSAALPPQSCRSRRERSGAGPAACPSTPTRNAGGGWALASVASSSPKGSDRHREIVAFDGRRPQALHRVPAFGDRLRRLLQSRHPVSLSPLPGARAAGTTPSGIAAADRGSSGAACRAAPGRFACARRRAPRASSRTRAAPDASGADTPPTAAPETAPRRRRETQLVLYHGGVMTIGSDTPASFQTPSLFEPCTRNT